MEKIIRKDYSRASFGEKTMQQAIPAREYSADERAERTRGAGIAFLIIAAAAVVVPISVLLAIWLR
jgi:hypothetical protein